jgi:hypothetical protein
MRYAKYTISTIIGGGLVAGFFIYLLGWAERKGIIIVAKPHSWRDDA